MRYFAYGSNMDEGQMQQRCPGAKNISVAKLLGYRFDLDSEGFATVLTTPNTEVWGMLWEISDDNKEILDRYEGVAKGSYRPVVMPVAHEVGITDALVYMSCRGRNTGKRTQGYLEKIMLAVDHWQLPEWYISYVRTFLIN